MAYVDDANFIVPHEDVLFLLELFNKIATPLGAVMNTDKTRILTTTTGKSILPQKIKEDKTIGNELKIAIQKYSTTTDRDGNTTPVEVTTGLHILGVPVGSATNAHRTQRCIKNLTRT